MSKEVFGRQQDIFTASNMGITLEKDHLLMKIKSAYNFDRMKKLLMPLYAGVGRPRKDDVQKIQIMILAYLYNLKDERVLDEFKYNMMCRPSIWKFCDMPLDEQVLHKSTMSRFRKKMGKENLERLFVDIVDSARSQKLIDDDWEAGDATHFLANVSDSRKSASNSKHAISREENAPKEWKIKNPKPPVDKDARWGAKSKNTIFYGYKLHAAISLKCALFTSIHVTSGEAHDGNNLVNILNLNVNNFTADKIYDTKVNKFILKDNKIRNFIYKKGKDVAQWLRNKRSRIESVFGEAKLWHGFRVCRYRSMQGAINHCYWTVMALNLKRMAMQV